MADPRAKLQELFQARDPLYRETAHFVIDTGRSSVQGLVHHIAMQLEVAGILPARARRAPGDKAERQS